ncbi:MAG TPA: glycosyltransferase 87 family protein [Candidatus Deferrimicrobium sp.]|nr:glycosyltransferase 87 family protein [Candidatus Deferrimicrobium sp.]
MSVTPRARRRLRRLGPVGGVLVIGLAVRAVLVPITHGADFTVWDLASRATLDGVNVYAHHPAYSGGPYSYFPLFLYIELPMQWLALHTGMTFTVLGKLPIVAADLGATLLIVGELSRQQASERAQAIAAALFFLNPLVLYNGAFYGRFDSVALAFLMLVVSLRHAKPAVGWRFALAYALAVAAKTFPVFLLPWLLRLERRGAPRVLLSVAIVLLAISAPFIITSPSAFATDLLYSADKLPGALSWQVLLHGLPAGVQVGIGDVLLGVFVAAAIALTSTEDLTVAGAVVMVLFLLLSKQVIEQYLIWPLPFLVLLAVGHRSRSAWLLVGELTAAGMLVNASFHPFGLQPAALNVLFAIVVAATLARLLATERTRTAAARTLDRLSAPVVRQNVAAGSSR